MKGVFNIALTPFDYCYGFGLVKACEVEEVGILVELVEDRAGAEFCVGGGEDGDAVSWELASEGCTAMMVF